MGEEEIFYVSWVDDILHLHQLGHQPFRSALWGAKLLSANHEGVAIDTSFGKSILIMKVKTKAIIKIIFLLIWYFSARR